MPEYAAGYDDPTADIILQSSDGVQFRAHSVILRLASDVFAGMISMPRPAACASCASEETQPDEPDVIVLVEYAEIISALLDSAYPGRRLPALEGFTFIHDLAEAADKYDFPDVTDAIRSAFLSKVAVSTLGEGANLLAYSIAYQQGWEEEKESLILDALDDSVQIESSSTLNRYPFNTIDKDLIIKLFMLRRRRWIALRNALVISYSQARQHDSEEQRKALRCQWEEIAATHLAHCRSQAFSKTTWNSLRFLVLEEMESRPSGQTLSNLFYSRFWNQTGTANSLAFLSDDKCSKCSEPFLEASNVKKEVARIVLEILPRELD